MAKMFYTIEEAASRLGKSVDSVREMAEKGQLQEFRDRDRLMFKVEQVDLLAGHDDHIPLAESGEMEPITLASSGTGMGLDSPKEQTGISIFDPDATEEADANAMTRVAPSPGAFQDPGKSGSGSGGLLDLTKEADDTSLGAGLLDDVYGGETVAQQTAAEPAIGEAVSGDAGGLFETGGSDMSVETVGAASGAMMVMAEPYDGTWSGIAGGVAVGMIAALGCAIFATTMGLAGAAGSGMMATLGDKLWIIVGAALGLVVIGGLLGMVLGKKS